MRWPAILLLTTASGIVGTATGVFLTIRYLEPRLKAVEEGIAKFKSSAADFEKLGSTLKRWGLLK